MATNTNLGGVFNTDVSERRNTTTFTSTENVGGLIFDTKLFGGLAKALGSGVAATTFANGNVVELNRAKDLGDAGIDDTVMCGLAKYHLDTFFALAGDSQRLFVSFMDSTDDGSFDAVVKMQLASNGIIDHIGVWTGTPIAKKGTGGDYSLEADNICKRLEAVAERLGGRINVTNYSGNAPLNILLCAPVVDGAEVDYKKLPDLVSLECPRLTVLLGQAASDTVHDIQYKINHGSSDGSAASAHAVVGCLGAALGCLAVAPANESIAHVASFNLAGIMQKAELGFGKLVDDSANSTYKSESSFININTLDYEERNNCLHKKGYVFLTTHDGIENGVFFSSNQTLSAETEFRTIARCRVMNKSRRVVRSVLLPRVEEDIEIDATTGRLSSSTIAMLTNDVISALDEYMVEPGPQSGKSQISGRTCTIDEEQDVLHNDQIEIHYDLVPRGQTSAIHVTEAFASTASN